MLRQRVSLDQEQVAILFERYGTDAEQLIKNADAAWMVPLKSLPDYTVGEIEHIAERECIYHLSDLVRRRSVITLLGNATNEVLEEIASIVSGPLGWSEQRRIDEIEIALEEAADGR